MSNQLISAIGFVITLMAVGFEGSLMWIIFITGTSMFILGALPSKKLNKTQKKIVR